jgi:hypothetical protein
VQCQRTVFLADGTVGTDHEDTLASAWLTLADRQVSRWDTNVGQRCAAFVCGGDEIGHRLQLAVHAGGNVDACIGKLDELGQPVIRKLSAEGGDADDGRPDPGIDGIGNGHLREAKIYGAIR